MEDQDINDFFGKQESTASTTAPSTLDTLLDFNNEFSGAATNSTTNNSLAFDILSLIDSNPPQTVVPNFFDSNPATTNNSFAQSSIFDDPFGLSDSNSTYFPTMSTQLNLDDLNSKNDSKSESNNSVPMTTADLVFSPTSPFMSRDLTPATSKDNANIPEYTATTVKQENVTYQPTPEKHLTEEKREEKVEDNFTPEKPITETKEEKIEEQRVDSTTPENHPTIQQEEIISSNEIVPENPTTEESKEETQEITMVIEETIPEIPPTTEEPNEEKIENNFTPENTTETESTETPENLPTNSETENNNNSFSPQETTHENTPTGELQEPQTNHFQLEEQYDIQEENSQKILISPTTSDEQISVTPSTSMDQTPISHSVTEDLNVVEFSFSQEEKTTEENSHENSLKNSEEEKATEENSQEVSQEKSEEVKESLEENLEVKEISKEISVPENLRCFHCKEMFTVPKLLLPCLDTFCQKCILDFTNKGNTLVTQKKITKKNHKKKKFPPKINFFYRVEILSNL
jgi:hypothetical protein